MHPAENLITCCGEPADIDADLVPIIRQIWAHGIHTQICCQGNGNGNASITFPDIGEADRFAYLVFDLERDDDNEDLMRVRKWQWELLFRLPLTQRAFVTVKIPRRDLGWLASWLETAPHRTLSEHPVAAPANLSPRAGSAGGQRP